MLALEAGVKIFRGNEFTTNQGDIVVFGFYEDIKELMIIQELREAVQLAGGFMIAAHPFRGFKTFGIGQLQMTVEQACKRKALEFVDAIEIGNGKLSPDENDMARKVAEKLGLPGTAGSDAHRVDEVVEHLRAHPDRRCGARRVTAFSGRLRGCWGCCDGGQAG